MEGYPIHIPLSERVEVVIKLKRVNDSRYEGSLKFAVVGRICVLNEHWVEVVRVDNSEHENKIGTHVHNLDTELKTVEFRNFVGTTDAYEFVESYLIKNYKRLLK